MRLNVHRQQRDVCSPLQLTDSDPLPVAALASADMRKRLGDALLLMSKQNKMVKLDADAGS